MEGGMVNNGVLDEYLALSGKRYKIWLQLQWKTNCMQRIVPLPLRQSQTCSNASISIVAACGLRRWCCAIVRSCTNYRSGFDAAQPDVQVTWLENNRALIGGVDFFFRVLSRVDRPTRT